MPYRDDPPSSQQSHDEENVHDESAFEASNRRVRRLWDGFIDFALQGNILEIAFGLM